MWGTPNGLPHCGTKLVPDEVFKDEKSYLTPYYGKPEMPQKGMAKHKVHKNNVISYHGCEYSLPSGSYKNTGGFVWVDIKGECMEIYDGETGKQVAAHRVSKEKGQYVLDPSHRKQRYVPMGKQEKAILEYCNYDTLAGIWLDNLRHDKVRYFKDNLRVLFSEMRHFEPSTLHRAFEKSLECGMYNAKGLISLCDRIGRRIPVRETGASQPQRLPEVIKEAPEKTDINQYNQYFS